MSSAVAEKHPPWVHARAGMLDLSQVGKPKAGRPGARRKAAEAADTDTAAILMQMADTARSGPGGGGPWQRSHPARFPCAPLLPGCCVCVGAEGVVACWT